MSSPNEIPKNSKIYLNKPYVQVFWNPMDKILTSRWIGFCTFDEISAVATRIVDAVMFEGARKILYDASEIEILDEQSQKYIAGDFTAELIKAGIEYSATILPKDIIAKFSVGDIQSAINIPNETKNQFFDSLKDALIWLKAK